MVERPPLLSVRTLRVGYGRNALLPPISFQVRSGEMWAIAGPNGAGKSTLLKTLLGLHPPLDGAIQLDGRIGYVPQRSATVARLPGRVRDVVASGVDGGWSFLRPGTIRAKRASIDRALELAHASAWAKQPFDQLSEGQKQRVRIARALAGESSLLVLDEPTSAMDIESEHRVMHLLDELRCQADVGVLLVSHHIAVVAEFATHVLVLDRDLQSVVAGPIEEVGRAPEVISRYGEIFVDAERHTATRFGAFGHPHACGGDQ